MPSSYRATEAAQRPPNNSGGIQGGSAIWRGDRFAGGFKPTAPRSARGTTKPSTPLERPPPLAPRVRHDPCVLPRGSAMVEAMVGLWSWRPHLLRQQGQCSLVRKAEARVREAD